MGFPPIKSRCSFFYFLRKLAATVWMDSDEEGFPNIEERTEDTEAWYARISSDNILIPQLRAMDIRKRGIQLVFPKSYRFLRRLQRPEVKRLLKHGWGIERTLFLDSPYLQSHLDLSPAAVGAWIIDVQGRSMYYKVALFSRGYVSEAHAIELEDTILHESDHLKEYLAIIERGKLPHVINGGAEIVDKIRQEESAERLGTAASLIDRYSLRRVDFELAEANRKLAEAFFQKPVLMAVVAEYWLGKFCADNRQGLADCEFSMSKSMKTADLSGSWEDVRQRSLVFYRRFAGADLPMR
jgi:hypothetical protein